MKLFAIPTFFIMFAALAGFIMFYWPYYIWPSTKPRFDKYFVGMVVTALTLVLYPMVWVFIPGPVPSWVVFGALLIIDSVAYTWRRRSVARWKAMKREEEARNNPPVYNQATVQEEELEQTRELEEQAADRNDAAGKVALGSIWGGENAD